MFYSEIESNVLQSLNESTCYGIVIHCPSQSFFVGSVEFRKHYTLQKYSPIASLLLHTDTLGYVSSSCMVGQMLRFTQYSLKIFNVNVERKLKIQSDRTLSFQTFYWPLLNLTILSVINYLAETEICYNFSLSADS